jgi:4-hydroxy-tetrahydrodipicolinate synthase
VARATLQRMACGADFNQLSGEDVTQIGFLAQGGHGCISVTANVAPRDMAAMHNAWAQGAIDKAMQINERLMPLHSGLFCETSPAPVKYGASLLGKCTDEVRLPLVAASDKARATVKEAMTSAGLLN